MGDRANILVKRDCNDPGVYLYAHWSGSDVALNLRDALAKKWRWDDCSYLTRIIFDVMTKGKQGIETGYGISTSPDDGEDRVLIVNCSDRNIRYRELNWSFDKFSLFTDRECLDLLES